MIKFNITKEELEKLILKEKLSYEEIGRRYNVSGTYVKKKAEKLGIKLQRKRKVNPIETFNRGIKKFTKLNSISDKDFIDIINNNHSWKDIIYSLGYKGVVKDLMDKIRERCNSLNITISFIRKNTNRYLIYSIPSDEFKKIIGESLSIAEVSRKLGINVKSGYKYIKERLIKEYIDISHFTGKVWNVGDRYKPIRGNRRIPTENILKKGVKFSTYDLKNRLFAENIKEKKCECCGITEWNGKPAPLELHHIDGDNTNNELSNLSILCPNCHAQTDNYCSKNKRKKS